MMKKMTIHTAGLLALIFCAVLKAAAPAFAQAEGIECVIPVRIQADGSGISYTVMLENEDDGAVQTIDIREGESGSFHVTHYRPGTYVCTIREKTPKSQHVVWDRTQYTAYVFITQDDDGKMHSAVSLQKDEEHGKADTISFSNVYRYPDIPEDTPQAPKTGDSTDLLPLLAALAGSVMAIMFSGRCLRQKKGV